MRPKGAGKEFAMIKKIDSDTEIIDACREIIRGVKEEFTIMAEQGKTAPAVVVQVERFCAGKTGVSSRPTGLDWLDVLDRRRVELSSMVERSGVMPGPEALRYMAKASLAMFELEVRFSPPRELLPHQKMSVTALNALAGDRDKS